MKQKFKSLSRTIQFIIILALLLSITIGEQMQENEFRAPSFIDVFKTSTSAEVIRLGTEILISVLLLIYFIVSLVLKRPYESFAVVVLSLFGGVISVQDFVLQIITSR